MVNVTGMFPYRMILNKKTNRFKKFTCGWSHPATWWFATVAVLQIVYTFLISFFQISLFSDFNMSVVYLIIITFWQVSYNIVKLVPLLLLFHVQHLKTAFHAILKADRILQRISCKSSCSSRRRTVVGIIIALMMVRNWMKNVFEINCHLIESLQTDDSN